MGGGGDGAFAGEGNGAGVAVGVPGIRVLWPPAAVASGLPRSC